MADERDAAVRLSLGEEGLSIHLGDDSLGPMTWDELRAIEDEVSAALRREPAHE